MSRGVVGVAFAAGSLLVGCGSSANAPSDPAPIVLAASVPTPRVLILSIDGLRPDALAQVAPPNILELAARGARTFEARTVHPSNTLPAHASMISGVDPFVHGITWDDLQPSRGLIRAPTVFSVAHAAGKRTVLVSGKNGFRHYLLPDSLDAFADVPGGDRAVAAYAVGQMPAGFDLMLVHFPDVDLVGHASAWMSPRYLAQIAETDQAVGYVLAAAPPGTTVILNADHGGQDLNHNADRSSCTQIPWMIAGPRIASGRVLTSPVNVKDTAATALHVLGLPAPAGMAGRPILEAFTY